MGIPSSIYCLIGYSYISSIAWPCIDCEMFRRELLLASLQNFWIPSVDNGNGYIAMEGAVDANGKEYVIQVDDDARLVRIVSIFPRAEGAGVQHDVEVMHEWPMSEEGFDTYDPLVNSIVAAAWDILTDVNFDEIYARANRR